MFGQLLEGFDTLKTMEAMGTDNGTPRKRIVIADCGQLPSTGQEVIEGPRQEPTPEEVVEKDEHLHYTPGQVHTENQHQQTSTTMADVGSEKINTKDVDTKCSIS